MFQETTIKALCHTRREEYALLRSSDTGPKTFSGDEHDG